MPDLHKPGIGEVWDVWMSPVSGHEQGGLRPALVISNDAYNSTPHGLRIVVPMTGTHRNVPSHLPVQPPEGGLTKPSVLLCEQLRAASVMRFHRRRGMICAETLAAVQGVIGMFIARHPMDGGQSRNVTDEGRY